jgi:hypothetical protein
MKKIVVLFTFLTLFFALPFDARPAISIEKPPLNAAQVASTALETAGKGKAKQKVVRRLFKEKTKAILENEPSISIGGIALVLLLSSIFVFLLMPEFAMLSAGFYAIGLFFCVIGLGKDKNKAPAIIALTLAILPVLVLVGMVIICKLQGSCFD